MRSTAKTVAAVLLLAGLLTGCTDGAEASTPKKSGKKPAAEKVVKSGAQCKGEPHCDTWIKTRTKKGRVTKRNVEWKVYLRCTKGKSYPACRGTD